MARSERGRFRPAAAPEGVDVYARDQVRKLTASAIGFVPTGGLSSTNVQDVATELVTDLVAYSDAQLVARVTDVAAWSSPITSGITVGNATVVAVYARSGKMVNAELIFTAGTTSEFSGDATLTLPVAPYALGMPVGVGWAWDVSAGVLVAFMGLSLSGSTVTLRTTTALASAWTATSPFNMDTGDVLRFSISYLAA